MWNDEENGVGISRLKFSESKLYGRSSEVSKLLASYRGLKDEFNPKPPEMVIISGQSGTGKTAIADQLREPVKREGGYFISGKFDFSQRIEPYTALIAAFTELSDIIVNDIRTLFRLKVDILEAVGGQGKALTDVIPSLRRIINHEEDVADVDLLDAGNRFKYVLRSFVRVICSPSNPLVLFLDDLQWVDPASLDVLQTLLVDRENSSLLVVGSYRESEVGPDHSLPIMLSSIEQDNVLITKIDVGDLDEEAVNAILSDVLSEPPVVTESLANIVHNKTHGNVLYVRQFLITLNEKELLSYDFATLKWQWNFDKIKSMDVTKNVVDLLLAKMKALPPRVRETMKVAATLGSFFKFSLLKTIMEDLNQVVAMQGNISNADGISASFFSVRLQYVLDIATREGVIKKEADNLTYKFVHDQIHLAAIMLVPENERDSYRRRIGEILLEKLTAEELDKNLLLIVDLLNNEGSTITDTNARVNLAELNFRAGKKALLSLAFAPCIKYVKTGIALLGSKDWKEHYALNLGLHNVATEALVCSGNLDETVKFVDRILAKAQSFDDKYHAYTIYIYTLTIRGNNNQAIVKGLFVLEKMGTYFPKFDSRCVIARKAAKIKRLLNQHSDLTLLPIMNDKKMIKNVRLLNLLSLCAYQVKQKLLPLLVFQGIEWTIRYGVCQHTPATFATYGLILCLTGDFKGGYEMGQAALTMIDKLKADEIIGQVYMIVYGVINVCTRPVSNCLQPLTRGYQQGMRVGSVQCAMLCLLEYVELAFYTGYSLNRLEKDLGTFCHQMKEYNQTMVLNYALIYWQVVLNLMGRSHDPAVLKGTAMDHDEVLKEHNEKSNKGIVRHLQFYQAMLYYYFGDYRGAGKMLAKTEKMATSGFIGIERTFLQGLIAVALAQQGRGIKWKKLARKSLAQLESWSSCGNVNVGHMITLLKAELFYLKGRTSEAVEKYKSAITKAQRCGFIQDRALANERLGTHYFKAEETFWASHHLSKAYQSWLEWGAHAKAQSLSDAYPQLLNIDGSIKHRLCKRSLLTTGSEVIVSGPLGPIIDS